MCEQDLQSLSPPSHNLINTKYVLKPVPSPFTLVYHFSKWQWQHIFTTLGLPQKNGAKTDQMNKNSSTLLGQNPGPCVDCTRGRGLLIIVPVRCENWADLGKFWGNGQMPNICCRDEMQALVLTRRGRDKYFYRWICLDGRPMHIWPQRKKNMQPLFLTIWSWWGFSRSSKTFASVICGKRVASVVTPPTPV